MGHDLGRLRWRCRRGMLELDLALGGFFDRHGAGLGPADLDAFDELLSFPDQVLQDWILGRKEPEDKEVARVVQMVRATAAD